MGGGPALRPPHNLASVLLVLACKYCTASLLLLLLHSEWVGVCVSALFCPPSSSLEQCEGQQDLRDVTQIRQRGSEGRRRGPNRLGCQSAGFSSEKVGKGEWRRDWKSKRGVCVCVCCELFHRPVNGMSKVLTRSHSQILTVASFHWVKC